MKVKTGDTVKITTGKDKGKTGKVLHVLRDRKKVLVEGVNKVSKHIKPGTVNEEGGIVLIEKPVDVSNVMLVDPKTDEPTRVGYKVVKGKKYRISKKTGEVIE